MSAVTSTTSKAAAGAARPPRVLFIVAGMMQYRVEFHRCLRRDLAEQGIVYDVAVSPASAHLEGRNDTTALEFAKPIAGRWFRIGPMTLCWQSGLGEALRSDLVIVMQENKYLINYVLQILRYAGGPKFAFYGHGRNMQVEKGLWRERFKRIFIRSADWWFAYTGISQRLVAETGYPASRITNVENAFDTKTLAEEAASVTEAELDEFRQRIGIASRNVGVYVGALYAEKRIDFLIEAAKRIRARVPDFELLVVGGGVDLPQVEVAAAEHPWIHATGPLFGRDKARALRLGQVFLMPGLVGLAILDCLAVGIPMVTTTYPYHSPEIDYLRDGENGLIVSPADDVVIYADAVARLFEDEPRRARLAAQAMRDSARYSAEAMAAHFADGIVAALAAPKL